MTEIFMTAVNTIAGLDYTTYAGAAFYIAALGCFIKGAVNLLMAESLPGQLENDKNAIAEERKSYRRFFAGGAVAALAGTGLIFT